jgi:3-methyladenine DNA glycosylase Tag
MMKIEAAVRNARAFLAIQEEAGSSKSRRDTSFNNCEKMLHTCI